MKIRSGFVSLGLVALAAWASPAKAAITITVSSTTAAQGGSATVDVTLAGVSEGGTKANNAQLDIIFPTAVFNVTSAAAVCTLDPRLAALNHTESLPTSPNPGAGLQRLRLNVIDSLDPLGDVTDGKLYTCVLPVKADAPAGAATLTAARLNVGDTAGAVLPSSGVNGTVTVEAPTPTGIVITVGTATAPIGGTAVVDVTLSGVAAGGTKANNAQLDIIFPTATFDVTSAAATCTLDPRLSALNHTESLPTSPNPGAGLQRLRLNVIDSLDPLGDVTDGKLYTCSFKVKDSATAGSITLTATRQNVGDTAGNILTSSTVNGLVTITQGGGNPTVTPTAPQPTVTNTVPVPTVTNTIPAPTVTNTVPSATPTNTARAATFTPTRTNTPIPAGSVEDEDGCQMTTRSSGSGWALLIPVMMILGLRRRSR